MSSTHQEQIAGSTAILVKSSAVVTSTQVETYHVKLEQDEDGRFVSTVDDLPGVISDGATKEEALDNVYEATEAMLESMDTKKAFMLIADEYHP